MIGIIVLIIFVIAGILTGLNVVIPYAYSQYIAVAILACLDSVFGAFSANIEKKFRMNIFLSGFFGNALIAMFLVYIGSRLNVDIYLAAVIVFTGRLLTNFTALRREFLGKLYINKEAKKTKNNNKEMKLDETVVIAEEPVKEETEIKKDVVPKVAKSKKTTKSPKVKKD